VLNAKVSVENAGLLENAKIELTDTITDTNFELKENTNLDIGTLRAGEEKTLTLPIQIKIDESTFNSGLLNMFSKVRLTGTYTNEEDEIDIDTDKYVKVNWTSQAIDLIPEEEPKPIELAQELVTYKKYNVSGEEKRIIQYKITSGITNNQYPIKSTIIELQAPKYDETTKQILTKEQIVEGVNAIAPEKVVVAAYSLNATNPNKILNFKEYEAISEKDTGFEYNEQDGSVTINVANNENEITWNEGQDEFIVTYVYPADVTATTIENIANSQIELHDRVLTLPEEITSTQTLESQLAENGFGDIITFETDASELVYKSNMYIGRESIYNTKATAKISCANIAESIKIIAGPDKLKTEQDQEIDAQTYYKNTYINKQELDYILGTQGSLKIYDNSNLDIPIVEINSQTESTEDGLIIIENEIIAVNYQNEIDTVLIEITNPANAGLLNIYNQKAVKQLISAEMTEETVNAILEEISSAKKLDIATRLFAMQGQTEIVKENIKSNTIALVEPVSDAEFGMDKTGLAALNENPVNFTIILKTDDLKYDLYKNPTITITLPDVVENIEATIDDVAILNDNGLQKENLTVENNQIILTLLGEQVEYSNSNTNTRISINAKVTTNKLIPTMSKEVVATVTNGKTTTYPTSAGAVIKTQHINLEAVQGILLATSVVNYNSENKTITAFEENAIGK